MTHRELFLASPGSFEDKLDCRVSLRNDGLSDYDIYEIYLSRSKKDNPAFGFEQHHAFAEEWAAKGLLRDGVHWTQADRNFFKELDQSCGVVSLTAIRDSMEMWVRYADSHKGFCVGLKTEELVQISQYVGAWGEVNYYDELPIIEWSEDDELKYAFLVHSKLRKWEFEQEYRLSKLEVQDRRAVLPSGLFAEIILGANMPNHSRDEILSIVEKEFPDAVVLEAQILNNSVVLTPRAK